MLTICEQSFLDVRFLQELVGPTPILSLIDAFAICSAYYRLVFVSDLSVRKCTWTKSLSKIPAAYPLKQIFYFSPR